MKVTSIEQGFIYPVKSNGRYKLIEEDNKYYILDLDQNKFSIFFPFINYITPRTVKEIDFQSAQNILNETKSNNKPSKNQFWWTTGIAVSLGALLRPLMYMSELNLNIFFVFLLLLSISLPIIALRFIISKNQKKRFSVNKIINKRSIFILPKLKIILLSISIYLIVGFFHFIVLYGLLIKVQPNLFIAIGSMLTLLMFLQSNRILYDNQQTTVKIK
ncbi:DUF443 family protein [Mammaliicoccus vitulinus]|nr:DUF443 family protein [Mammaliicoccus vitulinus]